jgi:hypothetical protein
MVELVEALYIVALPMASILYPNDYEAQNQLVLDILDKPLHLPLRKLFNPAVDYSIELAIDDLQDHAYEVAEVMGEWLDNNAAGMRAAGTEGENLYIWSSFLLSIAVIFAFEDLVPFMVPAPGIFLEDCEELDFLKETFGVIQIAGEGVN